MEGIPKNRSDERYKESNLRQAIESWRLKRYERLMKRIAKNGCNRHISPTALGLAQVPKMKKSDTRPKPKLIEHALKAGNPHGAILMKAKRLPVGGKAVTVNQRRILDSPLDKKNRCIDLEKIGDNFSQERFQGPLSSTPCVGKKIDLPVLNVSEIKSSKSPIQSRKCLEF